MPLTDLPNRAPPDFRTNGRNWEWLRNKPVVTTDSFAAATTPGTVVGSVEVFDAKGNSLGFMPIYDSIT